MRTGKLTLHTDAMVREVTVGADGLANGSNRSMLNRRMLAY